MLIQFLQDLAYGKFDRGMVHMPPGYAKTEYVSILFPVWYLANFPDAAVIGGSNTSDLAGDIGLKVRNLVSDHGDNLNYELSPDKRAAGRWNTTRGGTYFAVGTEGTAIGRRADLFVIDDPFRSRDQVENPVNRKKVWDWYKATVIGRMKPGGKILIMHTRWHENDLAGTLLDEMKKGGDQWRILSLPAIAEENDQMGRAVGEPLWPEWENLTALNRKRVAVGTREWSSQFQQRPAAPEGALFPVNNLVIMDKLPSKIDMVIRAWDLAATEDTGGTDPDWTVGMLLAALSDGRFAIIDVRRVQKGPRDVENLILLTAEDDGEDIPIEIPRDPAQAGKFQASYYVGKLAGYQARATLMSGSKTTRAGPIIAQVEANNLIVLNRHWTEDLIGELRSFPAGGHDDQVDALSLGFMALVERIGTDGIIKYYEAMVKNSSDATTPTPDGPRRGPIRPPGSNMGTVDSGAIDAYKEALEALMGTVDTLCHRCRQPIGSSRVEDGVSVWHPQCF